MNILLNGICGHMGREVVKLADAGYKNSRIAVGVDPSADGSEADVSVKNFKDIISVGGVDCIVDFSHHSCVSDLLDFAVRNNIPTVVATTGHTEEEVRKIHEAARHIPVFFSANMSLGVALLVELAKTAAAAMPDAEIEIVEKHHNRKLDAPSGTALMLANAICEVRPDSYVNTGRSGQGKRSREEIGIHAIRMGNIVGEHEVIVGTENQTITLKHEAHSRALFAEGALVAAAYLVDCDAGLYDMNAIVKSVNTASQKDSAFSAER